MPGLARLLDDDVDSSVHRSAFYRVVLSYRAMLTQARDDQLLGIEAVLAHQFIDDSGRACGGEFPVVSVTCSRKQRASRGVT